ncbi:hypothetical protein [Noviherbaspirillum sp. UKPF54]|uniref:hypothetical protein n=1 Tax=Noviherbaspirillum sp. UKPF54 TaxID=2601898 RepID=UPI0011B1A143|nr:hypothetical protein [Noviherbaspirillum sp. UKPF54]QDZ30056.1 hypothetical protein FAY22_20065 [Noviherbaspirillum sp. UKPF54]
MNLINIAERNFFFEENGVGAQGEDMLRSVRNILSVMFAASLLLAGCGGGGSVSTNTTDTTLTDTGGSTIAPSQSNSGSTGNTGNTSNSGTQANPVVAFPTTVIASVFGGTNSADRPLTILLQDDGSYFIVYSDPSTGKPIGVILGTGTLNNGSFASTNGLDLTLIGIGGQITNAVNLSASYTEKSVFNGNVTYTADNRAASFTSSYNNAYETLPPLSQLAGVYTGSIANKSLREDNIVLDIGADGQVTGHLTCGCAITAQLQVQGGTAYGATLDFKSGTHPLSGKSFGGNVYLDSAAKRLYIVGKMTGTDDRVVFVGTKS